MFELIEGGFNFYVNEMIDWDISWFATTIILVVMNVILAVRRFGVWCKQRESAKYLVKENKRLTKRVESLSA